MIMIMTIIMTIIVIIIMIIMIFYNSSISNNNDNIDITHSKPMYLLKRRLLQHSLSEITFFPFCLR